MKKFLPTLILLVAAAAANAERMVLEVITLQHRLVRDVLPILQPVLAPGGTATGTSNQLIVRSSPENLAEIHAVLHAIDTRIKQLRITITQDLSAVAQAQSEALSGHLHADDFATGVPDHDAIGGAEIGLETDQGSVTYRTQRTRTQEDSTNTHFVLGMEGQPAFIATGHQIPQPSQESATPYGGTVKSGIHYQPVSSGLYVTPRLEGDRVVLEVAPQLERTDPYGSGAIETHRAQTTVSGRLGEWISVGGANIASGGHDAELLARTRRQSDNSYSIWIKVEEQP